MTENTDRTHYRPLTSTELWTGWNPSIDHSAHIRNVIGQKTYRRILPFAARNDEAIPILAYPEVYPTLRTDYYLQSTWQLNHHHNDRSQRLLLFHDILHLPIVKFRVIDIDEGDRRYQHLWLNAGSEQSMSMTLEQKWYKANELKDQGNRLFHSGSPREALFKYSLAWFTLLPYHINAFHIDDPQRYMVASEVALFNNIIAAIINIIKTEGDKLSLESRVHIARTGLDCWACAKTVFYATSVGSVKRFKSRYDGLKGILTKFRQDNPNTIPALDLPSEARMSFDPIMLYCENHDDEDNCFPLDFKEIQYDDFGISSLSVK